MLDERPGFLTAGHTAPIQNAIVRGEDRSTIGRVVRSLRLGTPAENAPSADVAFVESAPRREATETPRAVRSVRPKEDLILLGRGQLQRTWVRGLSPEWALRQTDPGWGQVAITATAVAMEGDSGTAVFGVDGMLVGHVVAGTPDGYSVIQDASFQLQALGAIAIEDEAT